MDVAKKYLPLFSDFILDLVKDINKTDIEYIYRGEIDSKIVANTLDLAKINLKKTVDTIPFRHKIYFIMGEGLQNITKHQDHPEAESLYKNNLIYISKKGNKYNITTANIIANNNIDFLKEKLDKINELKIEELRILSRKIRSNTVLDENSNANIGLVEIAKRSGSKLLYEFKKINDKYSYFYLSIEINIKIFKKPEELINRDISYIKFLIKFHNFLNEIDTKIIFKGDFSQDNILSLLKMLKHQIPESSISIKLNNLMIEMLQNIEKHGYNIIPNTSWKPGFFMINYHNKAFYLTSANYIGNKNIEALSKQILELNQMDKNSLATLYKKRLLEIDSITTKKSGLGFIDMRRRSNNPFNFKFLSVNNKISLFIFQIIINT